METNFFAKQTHSSRIKANIVANYFPQYCRILSKGNHKEFWYLDLFSGPGIYKDGSLSTPILLAQACANDPQLAQKVRFFFNDAEYIEELKHNFNTKFPAGTFALEPRFAGKTVGEDEKIMQFLKKEKQNSYTPTLLFFDPWGYKGIDTCALGQFLKHKGNELFLFVNINRINAAIENEKFDLLMKDLFPSSFERIKKDKKYKETVHERLNLIIENLAGEFENVLKRKLFHCAFKFKDENSKSTSHFIIHFTKHKRGYDLIKQVYSEFDNIGASLEKEGTYSFDAKKMYESKIPFLDSNIDDLCRQLYDTYRGKTLDALQLFEEHQIKTKYSSSHYIKALRKMVDDDKKVESTYYDKIQHKKSVMLIKDCVLKFL